MAVNLALLLIVFIFQNITQPITQSVTMTYEAKISANLPAWIQDHLTRYINSDGEDGYWWDAGLGGDTEGKVATLLLTTVGRKSGNTLTLPLIFGRDGNNIIVIASKGGSPAHPAWYLNLMAKGEAGLQIKAEKFTVSASIAEGEAHERIWKMMEAIYPPYKDYQSKTDRKIPVVILTPKDQAVPAANS
jgi:deazaflavin-dependent oxidoreductase (nitroreductase family)